MEGTAVICLPPDVKHVEGIPYGRDSGNDCFDFCEEHRSAKEKSASIG